VEDVDRGNDEPKPGIPRADQPPEPQNHAAFVLFDNSNRLGKKDDRHDKNDYQDDN
jgi:hypothetical protein